MKLFTTFGSWGEIAPLLEIALQLDEPVCFATTADWAPRVREYGITCYEFPEAPKHAMTLDGFLRSHAIGRMSAIYDTIVEAAPTSIVASFFCFPAHAYAEKRGIPLVVTTTSPYYFLHTEESPIFDDCAKEYIALRDRLGLKGDGKAFPIAGIYPWYLHTPCGLTPVGWPQLRSNKPLSKAVVDFIKEPYGVVSRGTLVDRGELDRMVNAVKAHGLKCLYLGPYDCNADLSAYLDNHAEAVKHAKVVITHAGIGTTVDSMGSPMVVDPVGYDQHYNANRLIDLKCAVGVKDSYIKAITEALKPRSFLPNSFDLDVFLRLFDEYSTSEPCRPTADARQHPQIH